MNNWSEFRLKKSWLSSQELPKIFWLHLPNFLAEASENLIKNQGECVLLNCVALFEAWWSIIVRIMLYLCQSARIHTKLKEKCLNVKNWFILSVQCYFIWIPYVVCIFFYTVLVFGCENIQTKVKKYKVEFDNVIAISSKSEESNALCSYIQILTFQSPGRS